MYVPFFGLKQSPFSIAPDPRYLYMSERHREALAHLLYGVRSGGGFVLLTGEIGAGKTTVCRCFLEQVPEGCQVAYIVNPKLSVIELLQTVAEEFGIAVPPAAAGVPTVKTFVDALNGHLLAAHAQGRHCLLIIDEAQNLSAEVLEQLRLLTNLETNEHKLLQIILIGQPELRHQLAGPGLEQLAQRVIARYHLQALSEPETRAYVAHRLAVAGRTGASPFAPGVLRRVHALTAGVPRRINLLCDRALLGAYAEARAMVDRRIVARAAREVFGGPADGPDLASRRRGGAGWALVAGLVVAAAVGLWLARAPLGELAARGMGGGVAMPTPAPKPAAPQAAVPAAQAQAPALAMAQAAASAGQPAPGTASAPAASGLPAAANVAAVLRPDPAALPLFDDAGDWAKLADAEPDALRALALAWRVVLPATGAPCALAERAQLGCWRHSAATLPLLVQLDRPVVLVLIGAGGQRRFARLLAWSPAGAVLASGDQRWRMPTAMLAARWRGELITFWRAPVGYAQALQPGARGPAVVALGQALARLDGKPPGQPAPVYDPAMRQQVAAFQLAAGLHPDGLAGPTTFMLLNRALAADEPRLGQE